MGRRICNVLASPGPGRQVPEPKEGLAFAVEMHPTLPGVLNAAAKRLPFVLLGLLRLRCTQRPSTGQKRAHAPSANASRPPNGTRRSRQNRVAL